MLVTGTTRIVLMIGTPIGQVRSPALFNAEFAASGADRAMMPIEVQPADLGALFALARGAGNCDGIVLTVPHKQAAFDLVDAASERARALRLVNVVRRDPDGRLVGDMTDGVGLWKAAASQGFEPAGKAIALAGAGAAGTAIAHAFAAAGGREIRLVEADEARLAGLESGLRPTGIRVTRGAGDSLAGIDLVMNATPVGMGYKPGCLFTRDQIASLPAHAIVADAITDPLETELLKLAKARGLATIDGNAMTAGQFRTMLDFLYDGGE